MSDEDFVKLILEEVNAINKEQALMKIKALVNEHLMLVSSFERQG